MKAVPVSTPLFQRSNRNINPKRSRHWSNRESKRIRNQLQNQAQYMMPVLVPDHTTGTEDQMCKEEEPSFHLQPTLNQRQMQVQIQVIQSLHSGSLSGPRSGERNMFLICCCDDDDDDDSNTNSEGGNCCHKSAEAEETENDDGSCTSSSTNTSSSSGSADRDFDSSDYNDFEWDDLSGAEDYEESGSDIDCDSDSDSDSSDVERDDLPEAEDSLTFPTPPERPRRKGRRVKFDHNIVTEVHLLPWVSYQEMSLLFISVHELQANLDADKKRNDLYRGINKSMNE